MNEEKTFAQKVIQFDENLSNISIELPEGFKIINPFNGDKKETVRKMSMAELTKLAETQPEVFAKFYG